MGPRPISAQKKGKREASSLTDAGERGPREYNFEPLEKKKGGKSYKE